MADATYRYQVTSKSLQQGSGVMPVGTKQVSESSDRVVVNFTEITTEDPVAMYGTQVWSHLFTVAESSGFELGDYYTVSFSKESAKTAPKSA